MSRLLVNCMVNNAADAEITQLHPPLLKGLRAVSEPRVLLQEAFHKMADGTQEDKNKFYASSSFFF